jgi:hypothetical protein
MAAMRVGYIVRGRAHEQHWARSVPHHVIGHTPESPARQLTSIARGQHHQVTFLQPIK